MVNEIISAFINLTQITNWAPDEDTVKALTDLVQFSKDEGYSISTHYEKTVFEAICNKMEINKPNYQKILDAAFENSIKLSYVKKEYIKKCLDTRDKDAYISFLKDLGALCPSMTEAFIVIDGQQIMGALKDALKSDRMKQIVSSIFARYCFLLFSGECSSRFFSKEDYYCEEYDLFLEKKYPGITNRDYALSYLKLDASLFSDGYAAGCNCILNAIGESYEMLNNHCNLIVEIPALQFEGQDIQWLLYSDIVLYAEKLFPEILDRKYFRLEEIKKTTCDYIFSLKADEALFNIAQRGFVFKDCFVVQKKSNQEYKLLVVFEKNIRDERPIFCPACRSIRVQGNSYPILNVRSWECENPLCPDRSKYNRGKRFAFISQQRQMQMHESNNRIPQSMISKWHLDCVQAENDFELFEMACMHYSFYKDTVYCYTDCATDAGEDYGRKIIVRSFEKISEPILSDFKNSSYFKRYIYDAPRNDDNYFPSVELGNAKLINGDALHVLRNYDDNYFDGAVTSPPYYNAKSYSTWPNIYCYLYDMRNIAKEVYRVLKTGGIFLYNIFDYFDNENNIVLSAMGCKRMILGAYIIDLFVRLGFSIKGNIIWNKGEINGNRNFNQGNETPYYQAPLNCWEHVFIFSKGEPMGKFKGLASKVTYIRPVVKMVRGKNILGHEAPFPADIPNLLLSHMDKSDIVLDPFAGSLTSGLAAEAKGIQSVSIERNKDYYELCQKRYFQTYPEQLSISAI
jgi:DNA modification methylase